MVNMIEINEATDSARSESMIDTKVCLGRIQLKNPIIPASGTFGYGMEMAELFDLNLLGGIAVKGTTLHRRFGNDTPRIAEAPCGLVNAVGLQNPGIEQVAAVELPKLAAVCQSPILVNISGFSKEEYVACATRMDQVAEAAILEVNISCPNVHGGGAVFGTDPKAAAEITAAVRAATKKPIYMKLSPNVTNIAEIAKACEAAGADGISMINTFSAMRIDIVKRRPVLANVTGGLSGPAVFPIALRMVNQASQAVRIPIIGMGGIATAEDVVEMVMAGASAVQIGAENLVNPYVCRDVVLELPKLMAKLQINDLQEIRGIV
jgi:dihydroorotate dehydrogenase (NAD+) catalytic subunit